MKETIAADIVELEWEMFSAVQNRGGKAPCQEDRHTFNITRASQAEVWSEELLKSYHNDLVQAKSRQLNLMTEKYARMMESTFPEEYQAFAATLPAIDSGTLDLIEKIVEIHLQWKYELAAKYPRLNKRGRVISSKEDSKSDTSFETYLRGELRTYSPETVEHYYNMSVKYREQGENLEEIYLGNVFKRYGFDSLDQAEKQS